MIKATNPLLRPSLVHLRHEEWQNLEPKWGPGMRKCGGVGEGLGEEVSMKIPIVPDRRSGLVNIKGNRSKVD